MISNVSITFSSMLDTISVLLNIPSRWLCTLDIGFDLLNIRWRTSNKESSKDVVRGGFVVRKLKANRRFWLPNNRSLRSLPSDCLGIDNSGTGIEGTVLVFIAVDLPRSGDSFFLSQLTSFLTEPSTFLTDDIYSDPLWLLWPLPAKQHNVEAQPLKRGSTSLRACSVCHKCPFN